MNALYGWYRSTRDEANLEQVKSALSPVKEPAEARMSPHGAMCTGDRTEIRSTGDGGLIVALAGNPRWADRSGRERRATPLAIGERYRAVGTEAIAELNGMFALAILDVAQPSVTLAVDRFAGIPLYYAALPDGGLRFCTHLAAIRAGTPEATRISPQSLFDYVYFHNVPSPASIYEGIAKLEPATCVTVKDDQRPAAETYWRPQFSTDGSADKDELAKELHLVLNTVMEDCIENGRTYGSFLSGGLDSSTVAGLMAKLAPRHAGAFTMGFRHDDFDETWFANVAAEHFGLEMTSSYVEPTDIVAMIPELASSFAEPFGNSSALPAMLCARTARASGVDTLLAGDGGDELFAGNERYLTQQIFEHYQVLPQPARYALETAGSRGALPRKVRRYIEQAVVPMPDRTQTYNPVEWFTPERIFDPQFLKDVDTSSPRQRLRDRYADSNARSLLDKMLYLDWKFTLADNDLVKVSQACAAGGVSVAFPFLDNRLLDFSLRVPGKLKLRPGRLRYFYRHAMQGWLPPEIISKEKHGFGLPFGQWLRESPELREVTRSSVKSLRARGFIRDDFLDDLIHLHESEHAGFFGTMLWVLIALDHWMSAHHSAP